MSGINDCTERLRLCFEDMGVPLSALLCFVRACMCVCVSFFFYFLIAAE